MSSPGACFSKVPKRFGQIFGVTIPFISSQRRGSKPSNFAILLIFFTLKQCFKKHWKQADCSLRTGFSGPKSFRDFREIGPRTFVMTQLSWFRGHLPICHNWLAVSASPQIERISSAEMRQLLMTKLVIIPEQTKAGKRWWIREFVPLFISYILLKSRLRCCYVVDYVSSRAGKSW